MYHSAHIKTVLQAQHATHYLLCTKTKVFTNTISSLNLLPQPITIRHLWSMAISGRFWGIPNQGSLLQTLPDARAASSIYGVDAWAATIIWRRARTSRPNAWCSLPDISHCLDSLDVIRERAFLSHVTAVICESTFSLLYSGCAVCRTSEA